MITIVIIMMVIMINKDNDDEHISLVLFPGYFPLFKIYQIFHCIKIQA